MDPGAVDRMVYQALLHGRRTTAEIAGHTLLDQPGIEASLERLYQLDLASCDADGWAPVTS